MHFSLFVLSIALIVLFIAANIGRSRRISVSFIESLVRPSQFIIGYTLVFFCAGSLFFHFEKVLDRRLIVDASYWKTWPVILFFALSAVSIFVSNNMKLWGSNRRPKGVKEGIQYPWEILAFLVSFAAWRFESNILLLFSTAFYFAGAANGRAKKLSFLLFFAAGVALLIPTAAHGKRLLIFPTIVVLIMIWRDGVIRTGGFVGLILMTLGLIVPLSIMRGYGNFDAEIFSEALRYVGTYVQSDFFLPSLGNNIEAVYFYFHGMNSFQLAFEAEAYLYGETIINMFFLGSSLYGFDDGFRSSIDVYTQQYDPEFRSIGGSYPIMVLSEFVMNFGAFSLLFFPFFLLILDSIWKNIRTINNPAARFSLEATVLYASLLLARGSSFDLFLYNLILLGAPILTLVRMTTRTRAKTRKPA